MAEHNLNGESISAAHGGGVNVPGDGDILLVSVRINVILPASAMVGVMRYSSRNLYRLEERRRAALSWWMITTVSDIARDVALEIVSSVMAAQVTGRPVMRGSI